MKDIALQWSYDLSPLVQELIVSAAVLLGFILFALAAVLAIISRQEGNRQRGHEESLRDYYDQGWKH